MKVKLKPPPITVDLGDVDKNKAQQISEEFSSWLERYIPTWGWHKFAKRSCPELYDTEVLVDVREGDSWVMLKPHSGEQLSDLLRQVAEVDDPRTAAQLEDILLKFTPSPVQAIKALLQYAKDADIPWADAIAEVSAFDDPVHHGFAWAKKRGQKYVVDADAGDLVVVLGSKGAYMGMMLDKKGVKCTVKLLSGNADSTMNTENKKNVIEIGDMIRVNHLYSHHDDSLNKTFDLSAIVPAKVLKIDPSKGILIEGKDPQKVTFKYWLPIDSVVSKS